MPEMLVLLSYLCMMTLPLLIQTVLEHHARDVIEDRHHKSVLVSLSKLHGKILFHK